MKFGMKFVATAARKEKYSALTRIVFECHPRGGDRCDLTIEDFDIERPKDVCLPEAHV